MQSKKRATALIGLPAALLMALGGTVASAATSGQQAPAGELAPLSCSHKHSNKDSGEGRVDATWLKRRAGPHPSCNAYGQEKDGTLIYYHCWTWTKNDGTWTWGRVAGTNKQGWFKDSYLSDGGADVKNEC